MQVDVRFDVARATAELQSWQSRFADQAVARALNRTATTVRATAAREIAQALRPLKVGEVRKAISIARATRGALVAIVRASGRRKIPIAAFGARQTAKGVSVRVGGRAYTVPHAFLTHQGRTRARLRAPTFKGQLVTAPDYRAKRVKATGSDYPIAELFVPGVPTVFLDARLRGVMRTVAATRFRAALAQEIKFLQLKR